MFLENPTFVDVPQVEGFTGQMTSWLVRVKLCSSGDSYTPLCDFTDTSIGSGSVEIGQLNKPLFDEIPQDNSGCVMVAVVGSSSDQDSPGCQAHNMSTERFWQALNVLQNVGAVTCQARNSCHLISRLVLSASNIDEALLG